MCAGCSPTPRANAGACMAHPCALPVPRCTLVPQVVRGGWNTNLRGELPASTCWRATSAFLRSCVLGNGCMLRVLSSHSDGFSA
jgi:hypothetical protein